VMRKLSVVRNIPIAPTLPTTETRR
jgi:hypothetical protein